MRKIELGKHKLSVYDSIDELPVKRFHKYNKFVLIDAGIGSDISDFDKRIERALLYGAASKHELAAMELENLRQSVYLIQTETSPRYLSFAVLVKELDGKVCDDLGDDALKSVLEQLGDVEVGELTEVSESVKKKIDEELQRYFPSLFADGSVKEYYDKLKRRAMEILNGIINRDIDTREKEIDKLTNDLKTYTKPRSFRGFEVAYDKQFESMCLTLSKNLNVEPKKYSVLEFYNAYEYVINMFKEQAKALKKK